MIEDFELIKQQLHELSPVLNSFKSEAVQLRLIELIFSQEVSTIPEKPKGTEESIARPPRKKKRNSSKVSPPAGTDKADAKPIRGKSGRPGPGAIVDKLLAEGFFNVGKTPNDVVLHCKDEKVLTYNGTEISVSLARAVKSQKLKREKDANGQFLYLKR
jgi:hypothetical protein